MPLHQVTKCYLAAATVALLAGCGGHPAESADPLGSLPSSVSGKVAAFHYEGGGWKSGSGAIAFRPLGPAPGSSQAAGIFQVAVEIKAPAAIEDDGIKLDGTPLVTKGGGPTSRFISIYGAPGTAPAPGRHTAVAYARAGGKLAAVGWTFTVR